MYFVLKRLVWLAVLYCLIPTTSANSDCEVATAAASGTCAAVGTAASIGSIALCAGTFGIGCPIAVGVIAASSACGIVAGNIDCASESGVSGSGVDPALVINKLSEITSYLRDIEDTVNKMNAKIDIRFFEAKYNEYINKIRQATDRYQLDVLQKSSKANGLIKNNVLVREWVDDALGDGDYNVRGALDVIDGMIEGTQGIIRTSSVYDNQRRTNRFDHFSLKSSVEAKSRCFKGSFFYRTHSNWNDLPTQFKEESDSTAFSVQLKRHLWDTMIDPD